MYHRHSASKKSNLLWWKIYEKTLLDLLAGTKSKELLPHLLMQTKSKMPSTVSCEAKIDLISRQNEIMDLYLGMLTK